MTMPPLDLPYLKCVAQRPERFRTWQEAQTYLNVEGFPHDRIHWPPWTWPHLTDAMLNGEMHDGTKGLPFRLVFAVLVDRSGLPMASRAVLNYLARLTDGHHRRAWPKIDTIADRVGASRRSVQYALQDAERAGWVLVVRSTRAPSDYLLDVPDYAWCPCSDCCTEAAENEPAEGADVAPQGADVAPLDVQILPARVQKLPTHLVQSLGSSLGSDHHRSVPTGTAAVGDTTKFETPASHNGKA